MKTSLALVALLLAVCQIQASSNHHGFEAGKTYVYKYTGRVATGISEAEQQFSGYAVRSKVHAQLDGDKVAFQIHDIELGAFNTEIDNLMDAVKAEYAPVDLSQNNMNQMTQTFWVEYKEGVFQHIHFADGEDIDKHNVKKAIATHFQIGLHSDEHVHFYKTDEDSVTGNCPTYYSIGHYEHSGRTEQVLNVTKFRDYAHCEHRPHLFHSTFQGYKCTHCEQENFDPLRSTTVSRYSLTGNRESFVIDEIHSTGALSFSAFSSNGQTVMSVVNQTYILEKVVPLIPVTPFSKLQKEDSLHFTFHNDERDYHTVDLKHAHYYDRVFDVNRDSRVADAEALYKELEAELSHHKSEVSRYVPKFVDIFVKFDYADFENFYGKHILTGELHSANFYLLEILPFIGTNPAILYMMKIVRNKEVDSNVAKKLIMKTPFYVKEPSKALVDYIKEHIISSPVLKENKNLFTVAALAFGTILNKACVEDHFHPHPHDKKTYIDESDCKTYVQEIIGKFKTATDDAHRSVYLRTLINIETPDVFEFLVSVVNSESPKYDQLIRQVAITGLFNTDADKKELIGSAVVPIYLDPNEDYVIRLYAFEALLYISPTASNFGQIILTLGCPETPLKLKSYMYASLVALANTSDPCYAPWKSYARNALNYAEHYQRDCIKDSVVRHFSFFNTKYNYGRSSTFATVASDDSIFPREIYLAQAANVLGHSFDLIEMGYSSKGQTFHEDVLSDYFLSPRGLHPHVVDPKDDLVKKTIEKFGFKDGLHHENKPYEFYMRMFGKNVFATRTLLKDLTTREESKQIYYDNEKIVLDVNKLAYAAVEGIIANEAGLPVSLKLRVPLAAYAHGNVKFDLKVNEVDSEFKTTGFELDPDLHLGVDSRLYAHAAVLTPIKNLEKSGYAVKTKAGFRYPIHGSIQYDLTTKQLTLKHIASTQSYDVLYYKTTPYTILGQQKKEVHYSDHPTNRQYNVGHKYFGVGLTLNFTYDYFWNDYGSYRHFFKSFFKKPTIYEDYRYLSEKWWAGSRNFMDYVALNPTAKPFAFNARYSPSDSNPTTEFVYTATKDYPKDYDFATNKGHYGLHYKGELLAKGSTERKWEVELDANIEFPYRDHRTVKFHFKRSPLPDFDTEPFEICFDGKTDISDFKKIYAMQFVDFKANFEGHWHLGKDCGDGSKQIDIKLLGEKSEEQQHLDKTTLPHYVKCMELAKKGYNFNEYCWKYILDLGRIDKVTIDVEHKNIPDKVKGVIYRLYSWFRHHYYNNLQIDHFHGTNKPNTLHAVLNVSYHHPNVMDIKVERPDQTVYYNHIYMPSLFPQFEPVSVAERMQDRIARKVFNFHIPMCFVTGKYIRTFDGVSFKAPLGETWHLAVSDTYWNHVYIYFKAVAEGKYTKAAKLYFDGSVIKFVPKGDHIEITVDGQQVMHDGKDAYIKEHRYIIYKFGDGYGLESKFYRLMFYYDGVNGIVGASNFYRGKQHGLCGDFDGETLHEFEGPDGTHYEDASDYTHSYSVE